MKKLMKTLHEIYSPGGKGLGEKGFTLIELLVVVAILGVLAGVVVLNIGSFIGRGKCESYCTEKHNIQTAVIAAMANDEDANWTNAQQYLLTTPDYTWDTSISATDGKVSDASDYDSSDNCSCEDTG